MSFCCPVDKVIRSKRYRRMTDDDDDESDLDKILDKTARGPIKPFQEEPDCGLSTECTSETEESQNEEGNHWPWIAVLIQKSTGSQFCGGVLLNQRFVLTAAHCFKKITKSEFVVRLGEYDIKIFNETRPTDRVVTDIRIHPDYEQSTHANDIALLRLKVPVKYNSFVQPVCLPTKNMEVHNKNAIVAGWGQVVYKGNVSAVLLEVTVPIWEHEKCVKAFSQPIFKTNLCAGAYEGGKDSCKGDSGGPLFFQREDGRWTSVGIVSWGISCGEVGFPGVYTKVTSHLKWIAVNTLDGN
ncbi:hypothetical protein QTP88_016370 [Uroleucon formosanum]